MKTVTVKIYQFAELNDKAKQTALNELRDINVDGKWWEYTYDDAKEVGLKITSFDLDRNRHAKGKFLIYPTEVAKNIIKEHGENCETYKTAKNYLADILAIDETTEDEGQEELTEIQDNFLNSLLEDYSIMLQREYEYLVGDKAVIETIEANQYDFTEDGKMY